MKRLFRFLPVLALMSLLITSCEKIDGEGPIITEDRSHSGFKSARVSISGQVFHSVGNSYQVRIHAQQNILNIIQTRKDGDELVIKFKDGKSVRRHQEIIVELISPELNSVDLSGAANVTLQNVLTQSYLTLNVSGSGNIEATGVDLESQLRAKISGSGNIRIHQGEVSTSWFRISGSGNIHTDAVNSNRAYAEISGSGDIRLKAIQALDAKISGSGSIWYRGTPQITTSISGSGSIRPL